MHVEVVGNAQEAQEALLPVGAAREPFSLIVSDLKMPRATGIQFIAWLRSQSEFQRVPVILLSSSAESRDVQNAYTAGANLYMIKPNAFRDYRALVKQIGDFCVDPTTPVEASFVVPSPL